MNSWFQPKVIPGALDRARPIVVLPIIALLLIGCSSTTEAPTATPIKAPTPTPATRPAASEPTQPPAPPAPDFIEIGVVLSLGESYGNWADQVRTGYQLAVEDLNAEGGVYVSQFQARVPLRLQLIQAQPEPGAAAEDLDTLASDQMLAAVLGSFSPTPDPAVAAVAARHQLPYLAESLIPQESGDFLIPAIRDPADWATEPFRMLNALVAPGDRPTRIAILREQTDQATALSELWEQAAPEYGYQVVVHRIIEPLSGEFSDPIVRAQAAEADLLLAMFSPPDELGLIQQMSEAGWAPRFTYFAGPQLQADWAGQTGAAGDYVAFGPFWHSGLDLPGVDALNTRHQETLGRAADAMVGPAYATVQVLADAVERAGRLDGPAIDQAISDTQLETVIGPVSFEGRETGFEVSPILQLLGGTPELVWPVGDSTADFAYPAPPYDER